MYRRRNTSQRIPNRATPPTADPTPMPAFAPVLSPVDTGSDAVVIAAGGGDGDVGVVIVDVDVVVVICEDVVVRLMADEVEVVPAGNIINPREDNCSPVSLYVSYGRMNRKTYSAVLARVIAVTLIVQVYDPSSEILMPSV